MFCWFPLYNKVNQLYVNMYLLPPEPLSHPTPTSPHLIIPEHQAELPLLYSSFTLAVCFARGGVQVSMLFSQFLPPIPQVHSLCLCLHSCPGIRFISIIFLDVSFWTIIFSRYKDDTNIQRHTMLLDWKIQCCEKRLYYPKQPADSMQSLSNYQWHFSQN